MPTLLLVRHGRTAANASGILAGRTPGIDLDDVGRQQAVRVAERLAALPLAAVVSSPLERTVQTANAVVAAQRAAGHPARVRRDRSWIECGYGDWTGRTLSELAKEPLWRTVQHQPSAVRFPDGEAMAEMQHRAVSAARRWDVAVAAEHGPRACWVAVSHGDVIKAVLADALGMHLDSFQRLTVHPASVSVIQYTESRPVVLHLNDQGADLAGLAPSDSADDAPSGDAAVGGGDGTV